jgi:hypothetical protein
LPWLRTLIFLSCLRFSLQSDKIRLLLRYNCSRAAAIAKQCRQQQRPAALLSSVVAVVLLLYCCCLLLLLDVVGHQNQASKPTADIW